MKRKKIVAIGLFALMIALSSACGNSDDGKNVSEKAEVTEQETSSTEDELTFGKEDGKNGEGEILYGEKTLDEIKEDLEKSDLISMEFGTGDECRLEDIELIKRNTTENTDDIYCTISVNMADCMVHQDYHLIYNYYTTGGWILDEYEATGEQAYIPLLGVNEFTVAEDIAEVFGYNCDYDMVDEDTDFARDSLTDDVKVHISTIGGLFKASGTVTFHYAYLGGWWNLVDYTTESDYTEAYDFLGTWVCDYVGDGERIRLFLVSAQDSESLIGDYIQLRIIPSMNEISIIEEFTDKPFTVKDDGSVFWESQGYTGFYYDKNTVMETDNTPFEKYSHSYMTMEEYISECYPEYRIRE